MTDWKGLALRLADDLLETQKRCRSCHPEGGVICDHCCGTTALLMEAAEAKGADLPDGTGERTFIGGD